MAAPTTTTPDGPAQASRPAVPWREQIAPYARPDRRRSALDLLTSIVPYLALSVAMYLALDLSYPLALAIGVLAAGFLLRTFIVFHDCAHGSFLPGKRANAWLGRFAGLLVFTPFANWRHDHAVHHSTAADLDRRGTGDVPTLTVGEYYALPWPKRLGYRLFRNPLVMFGLGPIWSMVIGPRLTSRAKRPRLRNSVLLTNLALVVLIGSLCWLIGWRDYLLVQGPTALIAGTAGVWLFYVQHQFEDVYWETSERWSYADAALRGSSYLRLPQPLQFFTGNIGLHHVHHLSARVPNYNLQRAHDELPVFADVPVLTVRAGLAAVRFKLWDEEERRLLTWAQARDASAARALRAPVAPAPVAAA